MKRSIYPNRSQVLNRCFESAENLEGVLIVPIDFAKSKHVARLCLGTGEYLEKQPITVHNDIRGADFLHRRIQGARRRHKFAAGCVVLGGEDTPSYAVNFISRMRRMHYPFVRVNAREAKKKRRSSRASSDTLALDGIVQMILERRANDIEFGIELYDEIKLAARQRRRYVQDETACKNRIHRSVELLFPGFLNDKDITLMPYGTACLALLEDDFSVQRIKRRRHPTLAKLLHRHRVNNADEMAAKIKALADRTLPPEPASVAAESARLRNKVGLLHAVRASLKDEEQRMAVLLVQTTAFYLTTIPGIGVVLAAHIVAELGCPEQLADADHIASYSGIIPRESQTGGPDKAPIKGHLPIDCNHILKDYLMQAAHHVGTTSHPIGRLPGVDGTHALQAHYQAVEARGGKSRLSTAKKFIRVGRRLMKDGDLYVPMHWRGSSPSHTPAEMIQYYEVVTESLTEKWKPYDLSTVSEENNKLTIWKTVTQQCCEQAEQFLGDSAPVKADQA